MSLLAVTLGVAGVLLPVVMAAPAMAGAKVKSKYCLNNPPIDTSLPTPSAATDVSARKYGVIKGKAKVSWRGRPAGLAGYQGWWQIATSGGECTRAKSTTLQRDVVTRVPSGSTQFQVVFWYTKMSDYLTYGPASYSVWSNTVNVK